MTPKRPRNRRSSDVGIQRAVSVRSPQPLAGRCACGKCRLTSEQAAKNVVLEARIARLSEEEELAAIRPDLDGRQIMEILDIPPGPQVGAAYRFLLELRLDEGPHSYDDAKAALLTWWSDPQR